MVSVCRPRTQWHWESRRSCRMPQSSHAGRQLPSENWWTDLHCGSDWKQQTYNDGQKNYLYEDTKRKVSWFLLTNKTGLDDLAVVSSLVQISASKWVNSETAVITSCSVPVADVQCSLVMHVVLLIRFCYSCRTVFHVNCTCINSTAYHAVCVLLYVPVMIWMFNLKIKQFAVIRCIVLCVCYALIHTKKMAKKSWTRHWNWGFMNGEILAIKLNHHMPCVLGFKFGKKLGRGCTPLFRPVSRWLPQYACNNTLGKF